MSNDDPTTYVERMHAWFVSCPTSVDGALTIAAGADRTIADLRETVRRLTAENQRLKHRLSEMDRIALQHFGVTISSLMEPTQ